MANYTIKSTKRYLGLKLGTEEYGIDILKITTIIEKKMDITRVPNTPFYIKGVINLRGEIIPIMSLRKRFGLEDDTFGEDTRIIIINFDEMSVGLIADSVSEVMEINDEVTENVGNIASEVSNEFLLGVARYNGRIINLLNLENLVASEESVV